MTYKLAKLGFALGVLGFVPSFAKLEITSPAYAACGDAAGAGVMWQDCRKRNLIMTDFNFSNADFSRSDFSSSDLRRSILNKTSLAKANLVRASFRGSTAIEADFSGVTASRTDFSDSDLSGSNFEKSEIIRSNFSKSILVNVDMTKSDLFRTDFRDADLNQVDFSYSSLARADFRGAKLDGDNAVTSAYFYRTIIEGLDMSKVKGVVQWQMDMACGDDDTMLPEGIERPASWPCNAADD